jgi:hypothetical protein
MSFLHNIHKINAQKRGLYLLWNYPTSSTSINRSHIVTSREPVGLFLPLFAKGRFGEEWVESGVRITAGFELSLAK